jgi:hypothetical protein
MNKIVLRNGLIAGSIFAVEMALMVPLMHRGLDLRNGYIIGYTSMLLAFLLVFFGVRSYREQAGGSISFGKAFGVGLAITLIACAFYVLSWEVVYFNFIPDFADKYSASVVAKARKDGASEAKIEATKKKMADFKLLYANPVINAGMTLLEVFPVGLVVTLVSAAILRRKAGPAGSAAAATALA